MRHVVLTKDEVKKLTSIQKHGKNQLERNRSQCLLLSNQKRSMSAVAELMNIDRMTVVRLLDAWDGAPADKRFEVLYRVEGQGAKVKLEPIKDKLPELLEKNNRNTKLVIEDLKNNHDIEILGYKYKRVRKSLKSKRNEQLFVLQQSELQQLEKLDKEDYIDLYYADGSHFSLTPSVRYAWQKKDEELTVPSSRSVALSIFGIMSKDCRLHSQMFEGTLDSKKIIGIFDDFTTQITKQTVVVIDNAPMHHSKIFKAKIEEWKEQDLYVYFLPSYSPELNLIEILWRFIKYDWLKFDAYKDLSTLKNNLNEILLNVGTKYNINFQ